MNFESHNSHSVNANFDQLRHVTNLILMAFIWAVSCRVTSICRTFHKSICGSSVCCWTIEPCLVRHI